MHVLLVIRGDLTEELSALLVFMSPLKLDDSGEPRAGQGAIPCPELKAL